MGTTGSTLRTDGDAAHDSMREPMDEKKIEPAGPFDIVSPVASVVETVTATTPVARPPVAPQPPTTVVDRVVEIQGTIKHAYPLQLLRKVKTKGVSEGDQHDDDSFGGDDFSVGSGPCGRDATKVVAWEVQLQGSYQTCYVFLYDKWADVVSRFQRHYKIHVRGLGLVAIDHWDIGHDTEDVRCCYVVAEALLLKQTKERSPRLLPNAQGVTIEIDYEEPQRVLESDQITYQPVETIHARDVYGQASSGIVATNQKETGTAKKATQTTIVLPPPEKSNPRGKRTLRVMNAEDASSAKITTPSSYMYTTLADLIPGNANLYGVVVNMSLPKRSNSGYDFYMSLHLVDESSPKREDALQVTVFLPTMEQMPRVLHVGDVIRFHKIRINHYEGRLQGQYHRTATRYLVLRRGKTATEKVEQQTCSANWTFEKYDKERFHQLAQWADRVLRGDTTLPPGCPQPPRLLCDVQYAENFADVVVRVLHVQEPYEGFTVARLIVWDGSGDANSSRELYEKLRREQTTRNSAVPFIPERGMLMEVVVDSCWIVLQTMGFLPRLTSHWSRFRNLAVSNEIGEISSARGNNEPAMNWYELHFREVSAVMFVPETLSEVGTRVDQMVASDHRRVVTAETASPVEEETTRVCTKVPTFITEKVPATPIESVVACPQVPRKHHCFARVVQIWPSAIDLIAKPKRNATGGEEFIYSFVMRLEDATGQLDVIVYGDDAETFLHGIPPCDLTKNQISRGLVEKRLRGLLTLAKPVHFCIKSYKPKATTTTSSLNSDGANSSDSGAIAVRFRLFDTILQLAS